MSIDDIRIAITGQRHLTFVYDGHFRTVVPMALGTGGRGGWLMRAQQIGGTSSSGQVDPATPKLFEVPRMIGVSVLDSGFMVPTQYRPGDSAMILIDVEL